MSAWITPEIETPQRDMSRELERMHRATLRYAPQYLDLEQQYGPRYNQLNVRNLAEGAMGFTDPTTGEYVPGQLELSRFGTDQQRRDDIAAVEELGGRAVDAQLESNPWLRRSLDTLNTHAETGLEPWWYSNPLLTRMNADAQAAIESGGELSAEEQRNIDQDTLRLFAQRGNMQGNQAMGRQLLNRDAARRARVAAAQSLATGVEGLNQGAADISLRNLGMRQGFASDVARINASSLADPFSAVVSRPGVTAGSLSPVAGTRQFQQPGNDYYQDLFNTNVNWRGNIGIAQANSEAATRQAIATVAGGAMAMSDERLKENIVRIGTSPMGFPIVAFNYNSQAAEAYGLPTDVRFFGTLAQAVEKILPMAVHTRAMGFKAVDYELIDVVFKRVTEAG